MPDTEKIMNMLERILESNKSILECVEKKKAPVIPVSQELDELRRDTLLKLFWKLAVLPLNLKEDQHFPKEIQPNYLGSAENPAVVPISILKNRCGHLKTFRPRSGEPAFPAIFEVVVESCKELVVAPLGMARKNGKPLKLDSHTACAWSLAEARRYGLLGVETPEAPKIGWKPKIETVVEEPKKSGWGPKIEPVAEEFKIPESVSQEDMEIVEEETEEEVPL